MPQTKNLADQLDAHASWRVDLASQIDALAHLLQGHDLLDDADRAVLTALRERLDSEKLVLAFVAEFSRGKSELINAIFFSDVGCRVLPATPGRTTMCPVELRYDPGQAARLSLLPVETRLRGLTLAELRPREEAWQHVPLDASHAQTLVQALSAVTRTQQVSLEQATALGFWNEAQPQDNPPRASDGRVEVPAWRHAVINYPHALLERGLVVIDTPGLNAVGAEPELTLGLLPSAHAVVFVLAADTGVTRSDLAVWNEHLGHASQERFVVLNKIDTLADPLAAAGQVEAQIAAQCETVAQTLGVPLARVFAVSARDALAARVKRGDGELHAGRLAQLEQALTDELLPRRQTLLLQASIGVVQQLRSSAQRRLGERRRMQGEQLQELRGLRGKSAVKLRLMLQRLDAEAAEFEQCAAKLGALRSVQLRMQQTVLSELSPETLASEFSALQAALGAWPLKLGARGAFDELLTRLHGRVSRAASQAAEQHQMLDASFRQLNTDFGFTFVLLPAPQLLGALEDLSGIDRHYSKHLSLGQAWRMASAGFAEQFKRMLLSRLRTLYEKAASEVELWNRTAMGQLDSQLRDRRRGFARRREALLRVEAASGELEQRIAEVQAQDDLLSQTQQRVQVQVGAALELANSLADTVSATPISTPQAAD